MAAEVRYNRDIRPILSDKCFSCHGPDTKKVKAGLQLHSAETATVLLGKKLDHQAIVPGDLAASTLWARIRETDPDERMPPPESHHELSTAEIEVLGAWIEQGAKYEGHWAFQPVVTGEQGSIDSFIDARLAAVGLKRSPEADKLTLLRRLTQDLTGLPPTVEDMEAFSASTEPDAYEKQVDRLLASPAAAERLAVDWLDGARYADTNGYSIDDHRDMWVWRDWVIDAFLTNKRFDEFTVEQLAGDLLPDATEQQKVATGFLRNSMNTHEGGTIAEEYRVTYTADKVDTVATVFMGLTMKCAQCHDHKYDPILQRDYYRFFAFFNTSSEPGNGAANANTPPLLEAGSPLCSPERVKQDMAHRIAELNQLRVRPEASLAALRDEWELGLRPAPPPGGAASGELPVFPAEPPAWIWTSGDETSESAAFRRSFDLAAAPGSARLWVTCDNGCTVVVNGETLGSTDDWTAPKVFPVSNLKAGTNVLDVRATNAKGSPAGLILSLAIKAADGQVSHLATDKNWQARTPAENEAAEWRPAAEVAKLGDGPWGSVSGALQGSGEGPLPAALAVAPEKRSAADWNVINNAFAAKSGAFATYLNQLKLEERVLRKSADTGRSTVMVMNYKPRPTHILTRGAYDQPGEEVSAGVPAVVLPIPEKADGQPLTRLDLAKWLVDPANPLPPRVIVNRYWQLIFGAGLVRTAEDFGAQGEFPSHPELLDWLASDFVKSGWDVRRLLRQIVLSQTYRQSSVVTPELLEVDPLNRLLARAPRFRLGAEFVRDGALAAGGLLNHDLGGPSVFPPQPDSLWAEVSHYGYPQGFSAQKYLPGFGRAHYRRSIYTIWKRTVPPPSMAVFDAPSRETCTIRRLTTNTPLQALVLQNDPQFVEAARALGSVMAAAGSPEAGIDLGFARLLGRAPREAERTLLTAALTRYTRSYENREPDALALLAVGQLPRDNSENTAAQVAWTLVASTILNMDEAMTRQ